MLNNEYPPLGGGTGTVNKEVLERFAQFPKLKIDLITGSNKTNTEIIQLSDNISITYISLKSKNIHHASNFELIKYTILTFFRAVKMHKRVKYDFSFAWSTVPAGFVAYLLNLFFKLPYLVRVGGPDIPGFEDRYKNIYKIISPVIKLIWKKSSLIICKCRLEREMIQSIRSKLNIKIIYNGIDILKFKPLETPLNEPLRIICPARLIKRKGQDLLIEALASLKERGLVMHLDLIGDGDEKDNYINLAKKLNVSELVNFKGYIPREMMEREYQHADLFVLPSNNEGMSNSLLEAMACGLPVIVTNVGGTDELVHQGENGFIFQVGDLVELTSILGNVASKPYLLKEMGEKSAKIAQNLNWQNIVNEYLNVFNDFKE